MEQGKADQVKYSVGVLFVHGIGEQQRGDTLTEMGDALVRWLTRWCEPQGSVRILGTSLRVPDEGAPSTAHFDLRLMLPAPGSKEWVPHTWRLEESWWADTFRPSTFSQLAAWVLSIGSWVLATHFHGLHDRIRFPATAPMPLRVLLWPVAVLTLAVLVTVALVLTVLVAILALGVLILRLIPIGPIQSLAGAAQRALAMGFGDLMVLVQSPTRFAAMTDRARRDLRQLSRRCDAVVVIAHSQGSVVAWEAIRRPGRDDGKIPRTADDISPDETLVPENLVRFITFGQAMRKLELAYRVAASELNRGRGLLAILSVAAQLSLMFLAMAAVLAALGGGDIVGWATGWLPGEPHHLPAVALAVIIGGYSMLLHASRIEQDAVADELREDVGRALHFSRNGVRIDRDRFGWIDLWASADPAPNGPLTNDPIEGVESWRIRNGGSPITDHSTYWRNTTEFVGSVATELGRIGAGPPLFPAPASTFPSLRQALAGLTRGARIHVLVALRLIWIATAILGIVRLFPHVRTALDGTSSWLPGDIPVIGPLGAWLPSVLAFAALAIAAFAIWTVLSTVGLRGEGRRAVLFQGPGGGTLPVAGVAGHSPGPAGADRDRRDPAPDRCRSRRHLALSVHASARRPRCGRVPERWRPSPRRAKARGGPAYAHGSVRLHRDDDGDRPGRSARRSLAARAGAHPRLAVADCVRRCRRGAPRRGNPGLAGLSSATPRGGRCVSPREGRPIPGRALGHGPRRRDPWPAVTEVRRPADQYCPGIRGNG